ncbi:conserved hypothetical protein [Hahella chejuensis KCTC 2396]|uniref:Uncharacterized protein n=1 Tax=Hahella chejuensis (strain KCTC 2396) TaxID=349521 RepID=Q2SG90_HAHCH|nr:hypothetical protein [Hahella chejuensis]ABC30334.1 conserved hypothetical protein [Hahella chejuensis KCTC 2396]
MNATPAEGLNTIDTPFLAVGKTCFNANIARLFVEQLYGVVCDGQGRVIDDQLVSAVNQEHGILAMREGGGKALPKFNSLSRRSRN